MAASALLVCGVALLALVAFSQGYAIRQIGAPIPFELNGEDYLVFRSGPVKRQISVNYANNRHYYDALAKEEWEKFQKETAEAAARAAAAAVTAAADQVKTF